MKQLGIEREKKRILLKFEFVQSAKDYTMGPYLFLNLLKKKN